MASNIIQLLDLFLDVLILAEKSTSLFWGRHWVVHDPSGPFGWQLELLANFFKETYSTLNFFAVIVTFIVLVFMFYCFKDGFQKLISVYCILLLVISFFPGFLVNRSLHGSVLADIQDRRFFVGNNGFIYRHLLGFFDVLLEDNLHRVICARVCYDNAWIWL